MRGKGWGRVFQNEKLPGGGQRSLLRKWPLDHFAEQSSTEEAQFQDKRGKITVYTFFIGGRKVYIIRVSTTQRSIIWKHCI